MSGKYDLPDVHYGKVQKYEDVQLPDPDDDPDPESAEEQEATRKIIMDLTGIDIDELFDENGQPVPIEDDDEE